jgi:BirA family transcriptional regulator, biotin operon repressor / biotin---[acetyl-CoA-carboxylase] ligase
LKDNKEGFAKELIGLEAVDSTNRYALDYGKPFVAVTAKRQSAGRGRRGHQWYSPEGNLYLTLTLPDIDTRNTVLAGVAAREAIAGLLPVEEPLIKWPNDILVAGRKVAGILCESRASITAVGIGVNVNQTEWPEELARKAGSLKLFSGRSYTISEVAGLIIDSFGKWYDTFSVAGFEPIKECFLKYHIKADYKPMLPDGTGIIIKDIDPSGFLVIEANGIIKTLINEELFFSGYTGS